MKTTFILVATFFFAWKKRFLCFFFNEKALVAMSWFSWILFRASKCDYVGPDGIKFGVGKNHFWEKHGLLLEEICLNVFWLFLHLGFLSIIVCFWTKYHLRRDMFSSWTLFPGQCLYFYVYCISSMAPRQHVPGNMRKLGGTRANLGRRCSFKGTFRIPENLFDLDSCRP